MRFNPKARLDDGQIEDRTGGGGGGGGGGAAGGGMAAGLIISLLRGRAGKGGVIGVIAVIALVFIVPALTGGSGTSSGAGAGTSSGAFDTCTNAGQANDDRNCRLKAVTESVQAFWATELPKETGTQYVQIKTIPFTSQTSTGGCGTATASAGPFYCPNDQRVYLDLTFFDGLLQQLGGKDTAFTEAYVVAHEYGHHIQDELGLLGKVRTQQGANSDSVRLETMADCLAGVWAKNATTVGDADGNTFITEITEQDINEGIAAAKIVGDDSIEKQSGAQVNPEGWTHGSSAQRIASFKVGLSQGTINACNFFDKSNANYPMS